MMKVRVNKKKRGLSMLAIATQKSNHLISKWIYFQKMCIPNESKETMKDTIPSGIQHLDEGGMVCTFHCHPLSHFCNKLNMYSPNM